MTPNQINHLRSKVSNSGGLVWRWEHRGAMPDPDTQRRSWSDRSEGQGELDLGDVFGVKDTLDIRCRHLHAGRKLHLFKSRCSHLVVKHDLDHYRGWQINKRLTAFNS